MEQRWLESPRPWRPGLTSLRVPVTRKLGLGQGYTKSPKRQTPCMGVYFHHSPGAGDIIINSISQTKISEVTFSLSHSQDSEPGLCHSGAVISSDPLLGLTGL